MRPLLLSFALIAATAWAGDEGGWVSSGGELFKNAHNAWFVKNTKNATYCVKVAEGSVSVSAQVARDEIATALKYWRTEFAKAGAVGQTGFFQPATQNFTEIGCDSQTPADLRFLFGYESLSRKEVEWLANPRRFIGVTVRTDYDEEQLRGKGFIFIASDVGERAYENSGNLVERAWERPQLLRYALLHELGHVFGLAHTGTGLMSEVFLDQMLNKNLHESFEQAPIESFTAPGPEIENCDLVMNETKGFFGIDPTHGCVRLTVTGGPGSSWLVQSRKDATSTYVDVGTIKNVQFDLFDFQSSASSVLQITSKQKVFTPEETAFRSFLFGPLLHEFGAQATFVNTATREPKSVYIRVSPRSLAITGVIQQKIRPVFLYHSLLNVMLMMPPHPNSTKGPTK